LHLASLKSKRRAIFWRAPLPRRLFDPERDANAKWLGTYTIPRVAIQLSATFRSVPRAQLAANYAVPNGAIAPSLGRSLAGNTANATRNLVTPGTLYGDRINQLDFRAGKVLKFGRTRTQVSLDLYNPLNTDATQLYNQTFVVNGAWLTPTGILAARLPRSRRRSTSTE